MSKLMIQAVDDLAEGVYMASGDGNGDSSCFTASWEVKQHPREGFPWTVVHIDGHHHAADKHHSTAQRFVITFNKPVTFGYINDAHASLAGGDGTNTLTIDYYYHQNDDDNIGLGDLYLKGTDPDINVTGVTIYDTGKHANHDEE